KDWEKAEEVLRAILALEPGRVASRRNLALLLERRGRPAEAAQVNEESLTLLYQSACTTPSDVREHCPTLYALAQQCRHATEGGARAGAATAALLHARPEVLVCYDSVKHPEVDLLGGLCGPTRFTFHQADLARLEVGETDLLLIHAGNVNGDAESDVRRHAP